MSITEPMSQLEMQVLAETLAIAEKMKLLEDVASAASALRNALCRSHPSDCNCGDYELQLLCRALDRLGATK